MLQLVATYGGYALMALPQWLSPNLDWGVTELNGGWRHGMKLAAKQVPNQLDWSILDVEQE